LRRGERARVEAPLGRGGASLAPLFGQNNDFKKTSTGKRIVINQNKNRAYSERGCRHFPQVGAAFHLGGEFKFKVHHNHIIE